MSLTRARDPNLVVKHVVLAVTTTFPNPENRTSWPVSLPRALTIVHSRSTFAVAGAQHAGLACGAVAAAG